MNITYYFITRKIIRPFALKISAIYKSFFYLFCILLLTWPVAFFIKNDPTLIGVLSGVYLILLVVGIVIRLTILISDGIEYSDEPKFFIQFVRDCSRADSDLEKKFQQIKEEKKKRKKEAAKKKQLEVSEIHHRSDILDL